MRKSIPPVVLASAVVLAVLILRYLEFLSGKSLFASPEHEFLRSITGFVHDELKAGRFPIWNPSINSGGAPVLPDPLPSVFYPGILMFGLFGYERICCLYLIVHQILTWIGGCLLAHRLGFRSFRIVALAICGLLGQMLLVQDQNLGIAAGFAWLPFYVWSLFRAEAFFASAGSGKRPHWASVIVLNSVLFALIVLSGSPLPILLALIATVFIPAITMLSQQRATSSDRQDDKPRGAASKLRISIYVVSFALSLCLASPALIQFWEWERFTSEGGLIGGENEVVGEFRQPGFAYALNNFRWVENIEVKNLVDQPGFDFRKSVLIEKSIVEEPDMERLDRLPLLPDNAPTAPPLNHKQVDEDEIEFAEIAVMRSESQHIAMSVRLNQPSFVVLCDNFYPGWKASIDSIPVPLFRANGFARAVYVSAGSHLVEIDYRPEFMRTGRNLVISALCFEVLLVFAWVWRLLGKLVRYGSYGKWEKD